MMETNGPRPSISLISALISLSTLTSMLILTTKASSEVQQVSFFEKTNVSENSCVDKEISKRSVKSGVRCGSLCNQNPECRRYLFCSSDSSCRLYQDGTDCILSGDSSSCSCYRKRIGRNAFTSSITCPLGFYGNRCENIVKDCYEAYERGMGDNLVRNHDPVAVNVNPAPSTQPIQIYCILRYNGGTYILYRKQTCTSETFNRSLSEYRTGIGTVRFNFWIGFDLLLALYPSFSTRRLQVLIADENWQNCLAQYGSFDLGNYTTGYELKVGEYHVVDSTCPNSLEGNTGSPFSTYDVDYTGTNRCPGRFGGGWWFENSPDCTDAFLTGTMVGAGTDNKWSDKIIRRISLIIF